MSHPAASRHAFRRLLLLGGLAGAGLFVFLDDVIETHRARVAQVDERVQQALTRQAPAIGGLRVAATTSNWRSEATVPAEPVATPLFDASSWYVAPPPPPKPAIVPVAEVPAVPVAPALPFQFLGRIAFTESDVRYQLLKGERVLSLRPGESADTEYVFEADEGANLVFLYKPLAVRQYLPTVAH